MAKQSWTHHQIMFLLILLLTVFPSLGQAQRWELRVCAEPNSLPYSSKQGKGFENRIAQIVAEELGARVAYVWLPQPHARARDLFMQEGRCDLVMGIPDGHTKFLTTLAYYRTTYVFVYRAESSYDIDSYDDPDLAKLKIGVQSSGRNISPSSYALAKRGLTENQVSFVPNFNQANPLAETIRAVAKKEIDVGIAWGPVAGYFAKQQPIGLKVVPVSPQIEMPFVPMVAPISIGLRIGDERLRDSLDAALVQRWGDIQTVLRAYGVPLEPLSAPTSRSGTP